MGYFDTTALPLILVFEGSAFTNNPADHGGATKFGIIQTEYDKYRQRKGLSLNSVGNILMPEVVDIYLNSYWLPSKCNQMANNLAIVVFDTSVNMGQGRSIKFLQQAIGAGVDGIIGQETLSKLVKLDQAQIAGVFLNNRETFYRSIVSHDPTQSVFLKGWLRRVNFLRDFLSGAKTLDQIQHTW